MLFGTCGKLRRSHGTIQRAFDSINSLVPGSCHHCHRFLPLQGLASGLKQHNNIGYRDGFDFCLRTFGFTIDGHSGDTVFPRIWIQSFLLVKCDDVRVSPSSCFMRLKRVLGLQEISFGPKQLRHSIKALCCLRPKAREVRRCRLPAVPSNERLSHLDCLFRSSSSLVSGHGAPTSHS